MIEKVREIVKKECSEWDWKYHIIPVVRYSKLLAKKIGGDEELVELAALLHDIGRIRFGGENHNISGIPEAEKILKELNYPQKIIDEIKHCIESHRGSKNIQTKTKTAKIVANADAMAHFDVVPALLAVALKNEDNNIEKAAEWLDAKIDRDWNKKLTLPEAKRMMKDKYRAIKLVLNSMKVYENGGK
jgi:putative nucleotidyltransferase with HDIG domain